MNVNELIDELLTASSDLIYTLGSGLPIRYHVAEVQTARDNLVQNISMLQAQTTWLPYPENTPVRDETYNVLQHYPDGWDYQIAVYRPDLVSGWFSNILACSLRYVTHFAPLLPLPEES